MTLWVIRDCTLTTREEMLPGRPGSQAFFRTALPHHALPRTGLFTFKGLAKIKSRDPASHPQQEGPPFTGSRPPCDLSGI